MTMVLDMVYLLIICFSWLFTNGGVVAQPIVVVDPNQVTSLLSGESVTLKLSSTMSRTNGPFLVSFFAKNAYKNAVDFGKITLTDITNFSHSKRNYHTFMTYNGIHNERSLSNDDLRQSSSKVFIECNATFIFPKYEVLKTEKIDICAMIADTYIIEIRALECIEFTINPNPNPNVIDFKPLIFSYVYKVLVNSNYIVKGSGFHAYLIVKVEPGNWNIIAMSSIIGNAPENVDIIGIDVDLFGMFPGMEPQVLEKSSSILKIDFGNVSFQTPIALRFFFYFRTASLKATYPSNFRVYLMNHFYSFKLDVKDKSVEEDILVSDIKKSMYFAGRFSLSIPGPSSHRGMKIYFFNSPNNQVKLELCDLSFTNIGHRFPCLRFAPDSTLETTYGKNRSFGMMHFKGLCPVEVPDDIAHVKLRNSINIQFKFKVPKEVALPSSGNLSTIVSFLFGNKSKADVRYDYDLSKVLALSPKDPYITMLDFSFAFKETALVSRIIFKTDFESRGDYKIIIKKNPQFILFNISTNYVGQNYICKEVGGFVFPKIKDHKCNMGFEFVMKDLINCGHEELDKLRPLIDESTIEYHLSVIPCDDFEGTTLTLEYKLEHAKGTIPPNGGFLSYQFKFSKEKKPNDIQLIVNASYSLYQHYLLPLHFQITSERFVSYNKFIFYIKTKSNKLRIEDLHITTIGQAVHSLNVSKEIIDESNSTMKVTFLRVLVPDFTERNEDITVDLELLLSSQDTTTDEETTLDFSSLEVNKSVIIKIISDTSNLKIDVANITLTQPIIPIKTGEPKWIYLKVELPPNSFSKFFLNLKSSKTGNIGALHLMDFDYFKENSLYKSNSVSFPFELKRTDDNLLYPLQKDLMTIGPIYLSSGLKKDVHIFKLLIRTTDGDFITNNSTQTLRIEAIFSESNSNLIMEQKLRVIRTIWQQYAHIDLNGSVLNGNNSYGGFCPGSYTQIEIRIKHTNKSRGECHSAILRILKTPNVIYDEAINGFEVNYPLSHMSLLMNAKTNFLQFKFKVIDLSAYINLKLNLSVKEDKIGLYQNGSARLVLLPLVLCHKSNKATSYAASSYFPIEFDFSSCSFPFTFIPMNQTCQVTSNSIYPNTSPLDITNSKGWKSDVKYHGLTEHRLDFDFLIGMSLTGFYFESDSNYLTPQKIAFHSSFIKRGYHSQIAELKVEPNRFIEFPQVMNGRYVRITIKEVSEQFKLNQKPIFMKNLKWMGTKIHSEQTYSCAAPSSPDPFIRSFIVDSKNKILYICDIDPDLNRPLCYSRHHQTESIRKLPLYVHGIVGYKNPGRVFFAGPDGQAHLSSTNGQVIETHPSLNTAQISELDSPIFLPGYESSDWPTNIPSVEIDGVPYKATFEGILIGEDLKIKWK